MDANLSCFIFSAIDPIEIYEKKSKPNLFVFLDGFSFQAT